MKTMPMPLTLTGTVVEPTHASNLPQPVTWHETEQRLYTLSAWQETPFFSERERTALAWTEAVTRVADTHVPDDVFEQVRKHFTEKELVDLTIAIVAINGWNRLAIAFRALAGSYQPSKH